MNLKPLLRLSLLAFGIAATCWGTAAQAQYLFVGDYSGKQVLRFTETTGASVAPVPFINADPFAVESVRTYDGSLLVAMTDNRFGIPSEDRNRIKKYKRSDGSFLGEIKADDSIFDMQLTPDASNVYVTNSTKITRYDLATGLATGSAAAGNPWGISRNPLTGELYVAEGWDNGQNAVYKYDANLTTRTQVVSTFNDPLRGFAGITFAADGTFYVVSGGNADLSYGTDGIVYHYAADGSLINTLTAPTGDLLGAFAAAIGPDGDLYVSSFAGACVVRFDTATDSFRDVFVPPHPGFISAKTLHFDVNSAGVPEPGAVALLLGLGVAGGFLRRRRRA